MGGDTSIVADGPGPGAVVLAIGILALGLLPPATQTPVHPSAASHTADRPPFLAAFELRNDRREEFAWPHPSFPRATYASVLLVVDEMPRVRVGKRGQLRVLTAAHHLKINGRLLEPKDVVRCSPSGRETTCEERLGSKPDRLRLSLGLPAEAEIDPQQPAHHAIREEPTGYSDG